MLHLSVALAPTLEASEPVIGPLTVQLRQMSNAFPRLPSVSATWRAIRSRSLTLSISSPLRHDHTHLSPFLAAEALRSQ